MQEMDIVKAGPCGFASPPHYGMLSYSNSTTYHAPHELNLTIQSCQAVTGPYTTVTSPLICSFNSSYTLYFTCAQLNLNTQLTAMDQL